jgi:ribosomal protein S18 acetylase RimI-like enzyme
MRTQRVEARTTPVTSAPPPPGASLRLLSKHDLAAVVEIDAKLSGRSRRDYFERRLLAAQREPELHLAIKEGGHLRGFLFARRLDEEFGRSEPALRLQVIGVDPDAQRRSYGLCMLGELEACALRQGIGLLRTQAHWKNHGMLRFLDRAGFELDRNHVIDCEVRAGRIVAARDDEALTSGQPRSGDKNDYSAPSANDFEALARDHADVRSLSPEDIGDLVRIDRRLTGRDRTEYIARQLQEALQDSAVRVSLAAFCDGAVAGYLAARVDFGDVGRTESTAVIDTLAVDPERTGTGIGTALISQLLVNLMALRVERVETEVAPDGMDLLAFFYRLGFGPSARLGFVKRLSQAGASS